MLPASARRHRALRGARRAAGARATGRFAGVLGNAQLMRLNFGCSPTPSVQTAMWVLVPAGLVAAGLPMAEHWKVYLPAVLLSFIGDGAGGDHGREEAAMTGVFNAAIVLLLVVQAGSCTWRLGCGRWPAC